MQTSTYCPEDNKIRLYVGRVPHDEYLQLKKEGWTSTPKQDCDFSAAWSVRRENTAIEYSDGIIEDEDQSPQNRAADRAERFGGYLEKRENEASQLAENYDNGPNLHGYQSQAVAERSAKRHDLQATKACNQWGKAEYWQRRTAGVISNALHKSAPGVRMGRIKVIESDIRKQEQNLKEYKGKFSMWWKILDIAGTEKAFEMARQMANFSYDSLQYNHPRQDGNKQSLYSLLTDPENPITGHEAAQLWLAKHKKIEGEGRYLTHLRLRLSYENQMIEAQGGRLASVDIEPGGFIGKEQIVSVHKSPKTGRVVSVNVKIEKKEGWTYRVKGVPGADYDLLSIKTERLNPGVYRDPTDEERQAFEIWQKEDKKARASKTPKAPPLLNLTTEDAERLQAVWNEEKTSFDHEGTVKEMTQKEYSAASAGSYGRAKTVFVHAGGSILRYSYVRENLPAVAKVRRFRNSVVVLTDKPQKPAPEIVWEEPKKAGKQ